MSKYLDKRVKVLTIALLAVIAGFALYAIVPTMSEGNYLGELVILSRSGREISVKVDFRVGLNATDIVHKEVINVDNGLTEVVIRIPAVKTIKLGSSLSVDVAVNNTDVVDASKLKFKVTTPTGYTFTYIPVSSSVEKVNFKGTILHRTKEAAFVFASALTLFIGASIVPYIITSIYSTLALYLVGALTLTDPFTMYMSDTCLVFLAGSAFELVLKNTGLANRIANALRKMSSSPSRLFIGTFVLSGFLSMWMSNTSATYLFLPIVGAIAARAAIEDTKLYELVLVGLAAGTTCGGMATIIGTPPNLIASGYLNSNIYGGKSVITFNNWLMWGIPLFIIGTAIAYATYYVMYRAMGKEEVNFVLEKLKKYGAERELGKKWSKYEVVGLAGISFLVLLWVTESIHGIKTGVAGMIGLLVFLATGTLKVKQVKDLSWDIVILMGAGLTLGRGLMETGLSDWLVQFFMPLLNQPILLLCLVGIVALIIGTVISSHTSATAFIVPIVAPIGFIVAAGMELASARLGAAASVIIATCCVNWAIALPISTPPSAIVFGTGKLRVKTLATFGLIWGIAGTALTLLLIPQIVFRVLPP